MKNLKRISICFAALLLTACLGTQTSPNAAQNGGTLMLPLGNTTADTDYKRLSKTQFTAQITDANSQTAAVKVRAIFPLRPDATAKLTQRSADAGLWMMIVDLVNPSTQQNTAFAAGSATLTISNTAGLVEQNNYSVPLSILSGTGSISPISEVGDALFDELNASPQVRVAVVDAQSEIDSSHLLGSITLKFRYPTSALNSAADKYWPRPILTSADGNLNMLYRTETTGSDKVLTVTLLNPRGIGTLSADRDNRSGALAEVTPTSSIGLSIIYDTTNTAINAASLQLIETRYVGVTGSSATFNNVAVSVN